MKKMIISIINHRISNDNIAKGKGIFHSLRLFSPGKFTLLLFILLVQAIRLEATNIEITDRKYLYTMDSGIPSTYTTSVLDPEFSDIYTNTALFKDKKATGYLQLGIDPDVLFCHEAYLRMEVVFQVTTKTVNSWNCGDNGSTDTTTQTDMQTLTISFDPAAQQIYTEKARILFNNAYYVKAVVASVTVYDISNAVVFSGTGYSSLAQDLYWETGLQYERYHNFTYSSSPANFEVNIDNTTNEIVFTWTQKTGAVFYEIEFTHAHDYTATGYYTGVSPSGIQTTFNNNATRVRLLEGITEYRIPNIFERGYVLARIRAIGMKGFGTDGCDMTNEIPGYWSFEENPSTPFVLASMSTDHYKWVDSHEGSVFFPGNNKNWKMSGSYAEDGKHKEIVEYADGSSRVRQSVTKLSTTEEVIIGETMYDYQGRPTVQILPVPVDGDKVISYHANFNLEDASSDKFSRIHFDDNSVFSGGSCIPTPPMLSTLSGASYYYSSANTNTVAQQAFVADAYKYPYTQVVYTPDNTGRIKMQSGVGDAHILGSGHETKYFYGKPFQEELDRLFGTNVGYKSHYQKNMVIDANGQVSISYLDMSGKTIATALAGEPAPNMMPLVDSIGVDLWESVAETLEVNLLGDSTSLYPNGEDNHLSANGMVWSNTTPLLVEATGTYRFTYETTLHKYLDSCLQATCFDCVYDLKINVLNSCNEPEPGFPVSIHLGADFLDTLCNDTNIFTLRDSSNNAYKDVILQVGNYTVVKTLSLDEDAIGYYTDQYIKNNTCLKTPEDFYQMPDTSGCYYSCEDCLAELGDTTSFFAANPGISLPQLRILYNTKKAVCEEMCDKNNNDLCKAAYKSMLRDMTPRGQYAVYDTDANGNAVIPEDKLSIFHNEPYLPDHTNFTVTAVGGSYPHDQLFPPQSEPWRHPHYFDKDDPNSYIPSPSYADPSHAFYFDENGEKSKVYLDQDINGDWVPAVTLTAYVQQDSIGHYVYPQELLYMDDFISRFNSNDAWAKSLLVYHPEFLYMKECVHVNTYSVNLNIGGAGAKDYDTWAFNEALLTMDVADAGDVMPSTVGSIFDLRENDPFFQNFGSNSVLGGYLVNDMYDYMANNYAPYPAIPTILNIHQVAYGTVNCVTTSPLFPSDCIGITGSNSSLISGDPEAWDHLVGSYISIKTEVLLRYLHMKLFNDYFTAHGNFITNQCIGAADYDVEAKPHTLDPWMPCDLVEYFRYAEKQVRFGLPDAIYNNGAFDPSPPDAEQLMAYGQQQVYQATGLCPAAIDLQSLMYGLKHTNNLVTVSHNLDANNYLGIVLRDKIKADNAGIVPSYTGSISGQVYTGVTGTNTITLTLPGGYNWADVQMIGNIDDVTLTLGDYTFTLQAQVLNTTTSEMDWVELSGWTNLRIGNCKPEIPKICKATPEAKDLKALLDALKTAGLHDNTGVDLSFYNDLITPALVGYLGGGSPSDYEWNYNTGTDIGQLLNTSTGKYITLNITSGAAAFETTSFEIFNISGSVSTSPTATTDNGFIINGYTNIGSYYIGLPTDISFSGTISWYNGSTTNDFAVTDCQDPMPMDCQTIPHQNFNELRGYIENETASENPCIKPTSTTFPADYTLISLHADMEFSTDVITTQHFIAIILPDGETENDTIKGTYCKNIRECLDCEETPPPCDGMYFNIDVTRRYEDPYTVLSHLSPEFEFDLPGRLDTCYMDYANLLIFDAGTEMTGTPYTLDDILVAWAGKINAGGNGDISATYTAGSGTLKLNLHELTTSHCGCTPGDQGELLIIVHDTIPMGRKAPRGVRVITPENERHLLYDAICCGEEPEPGGCKEIYFTVDVSNDVLFLPVVRTATYQLNLPADLRDCFDPYLSALSFDANAEMTPGLFGLPDVFAAWVSKINTNGGGFITADYVPGAYTFKVTLNTESTKCKCTPEDSAEFVMYPFESSEAYLQKFPDEVCCVDSTEPPPCDGLYFTVDLTGQVFNEGQYEDTYFVFGLPIDLAACYETYQLGLFFNVATDMPGGPFTIEQILEGWADKINATLDGYITATHTPGTEIINISLHHLDSTSCVCTPEYRGQLYVFDMNDTSLVYNEYYHEICCGSDPDPEPEHCDEAYFTIDFGNYAITKSMTRKSTYLFELPPALASCYDAFDSVLTFNAVTEMTGTFTLQDVIDAWIAKINAGGGGNITAQAGTGVQPIQITLHNLSELGCVCTEGDSGTFSMSVPAEEVFYFSDQIDEVCCTDSNETSPCDSNGIYFTLDLSTADDNPSLLINYILSFSLPNTLRECYAAYLSLLTFNVKEASMSPPYTFDHVLDLWAAQINTGGGGNFTAIHTAGTETMTIVIHNLDITGCSCEAGVTGDLEVNHVVEAGNTSIYQNSYPENCCGSTPTQCDDLSFTLDLTAVDDNVFSIINYLFVFNLPSPLGSCFTDPLGLLTYDVNSEMGSGPYNVPSILDAWAMSINTGGGGNISASRFPGTDIMIIKLHNVSAQSPGGCSCEPSKQGNLYIYMESSPNQLLYDLSFNEVCCTDGISRPNSKSGRQLLLIGSDTTDTNSTWEPHLPITLGSPCDMNLTPFPPPPPVTNDCVQSLLAAAQLNADNAYEDYLDSVKAAFRAAYIQTCMNVTEDFRATFTNEQYHFTLYYYDQAGNLAKTVPPKAVRTIANANLDQVTNARNTSSVFLAEHDKANLNDHERLTTKYQYNTLNQPRYQETPDGGNTAFIYDALGRMAVSQNAKQAANTNTICSVTKYDQLGRIIMVGEMNSSIAPLITQDNALTQANLDFFISTSPHIYQVTYTFYDEAMNGFPQDNLRNRVSGMTYMDDSEDTERSLVYYSYDIHGNVKTYWQENRLVPTLSEQVKRMDYEYDLVSGKVNKFIYQRGAQDQWIHRYEYDADNRLTKVETSRDNVFYDRDAAYFYYKHGPLARTELGELNVQGIDYAYTIHGWMKAVNSTHLNTKTDMGKDGDHSSPGPHRYYATDAFSYALHYYDGDYQNITANPDPVADVSSISYSSLYNGNIAMMQTSLYDISSTPTKSLLLSRYTYDQLNRIKIADYNADYDPAMNVWNNTFDGRYANGFNYDANGNIIFQGRNGEVSNPDMDKLTYHYTPGTNQLDYVYDAYTSTYTDDIKEGQTAGNYKYDLIGNLISDSAEQINNIDWTVYGKVKRVEKTGTDMVFYYSPTGQRIQKTVDVSGQGAGSQYYVYDPSGNMIAVYRDHEDEAYTLEELNIYGSSRLGSVVVKEIIPDTANTDSNIYEQKRGQKRYELSNHLGNILATISDRRTLDCEDNVYLPDIITSTDYSPFGAPLPGRTWTKVGTESYRFGFNGQEKDNEIGGEGNSYTAEYWQYDSRLGRRWNIDPKSAKYSWQSPYTTFNNCPTFFNDPFGLEAEASDPQKKAERQDRRFEKLEKRLASRFEGNIDKYNYELTRRGSKPRFGGGGGEAGYQLLGNKGGKKSSKTGVKYKEGINNRKAEFQQVSTLGYFGFDWTDDKKRGTEGALGGNEVSVTFDNVKDGETFYLQANTFGGFQVQILVDGVLVGTFQPSPQEVPDGDPDMAIHNRVKEIKPVTINTGSASPQTVVITFRTVFTAAGAKVHHTSYSIPEILSRVRIGRRL